MRFLLAGGLGLVGIGLLLMSGLDAESGWTALLPGFLLAGVGVGLTNPAIASAAVGVVDQRRAGMASGVNSTFRQVGIATGIAGLGAIFQATVTGNITDALRDAGVQRPPGAKLPPAEVLAQGNPRVLGPLHDPFVTGWTGALNEILIIAAIVALAGALAAALLVRGSDFVAHGGAPPPEPVVQGG